MNKNQVKKQYLSELKEPEKKNEQKCKKHFSQKKLRKKQKARINCKKKGRQQARFFIKYISA